MELMNKEDIIFSETVQLKDGKLLRKVENVEESEKIIEILKKNNMLGSCVVDTRVFSVDEKCLEHDFIPNIIYSGEYTESMAFDVTQESVNMAKMLYDEGLYSWDLMPHNFTFCDGKWILDDFGSFSLNPVNVKTQVRSLFKITFSAFELKKVINRKKLKHYYLNRIKTFDLFKMIPFKNWFLFFCKLKFCLLLCSLGLYKQVYYNLDKIFKEYLNSLNRIESDYTLSTKDKNIFEYIEKIVQYENAESVFYIGVESAKYAQAGNKNFNLKKFVYIDDYDDCDSFYNFIRKNNIKNISTGVFYPYLFDDEIPNEYKYRALYDSFTAERFKSNAVIISDIDESLSDNIDEYLDNVSQLTSNLLIIKLNNTQFEKYINNLDTKLKKIFNSFEIINFESEYLLVCKQKFNNEILKKTDKEYINYNRGPEAKYQTKKILEIIKRNKN